MTAIIIEDEALAAEELSRILRDLAPELRILAFLDSVRESVEWLRTNRVDLIFSDIHLGDGKSFEIFSRVEVTVPVVFITAYDEYALEAFQHQGVAYILKPFDREAIGQTLRKVNTWFGQETPGQKSGAAFQTRWLVQLGNKMKSVPVEEIAYFMADGKYLMLYTFDGAEYIVDQTITGIEPKLNPRLFFRINRKFIVSFKSIREMLRYSNSRIRVVLAPKPPSDIEAIVSTERLPEFKEWLNR